MFIHPRFNPRLGGDPCRGPVHISLLVEIRVIDVRNAPRFWTKYIQSIPELRLVYISTTYYFSTSVQYVQSVRQFICNWSPFFPVLQQQEPERKYHVVSCGAGIDFRLVERGPGALRKNAALHCSMHWVCLAAWVSVLSVKTTENLNTRH